MFTLFLDCRRQSASADHMIQKSGSKSVSVDLTLASFEAFHVWRGSVCAGAKVGHRSLVRYYKQRFGTQRALVLTHNTKAVGRVLRQYKALGWGGDAGEADTCEPEKRAAFCVSFRLTFNGNPHRCAHRISTDSLLHKALGRRSPCSHFVLSVQSFTKMEVNIDESNKWSQSDGSGMQDFTYKWHNHK